MRHPRRATRALRSAVEMLECRRLLAAFTVSGTSGADTITIADDGGNLSVTVNDQQSSESGFFTSLIINADAGNDTVSIVSLPANYTSVTITGDAGNDLIFGSAV